MKQEILRFVEPIYRFCLKRLSSHADAEDLSQEILLCVLLGIKHSDISNLDGYVWKTAYNRYAKRICTQKEDAIVLCGDEYLFDVSDELDDHDKDEYQVVFRSLHTLSSMYREILVEYYVHNLSVRDISVKYGISTEVVKWRLHVGREKVKERLLAMDKTYEKIKMNVMCNGSFSPTQYLDMQIYKAIAKTCYESPLTIEEISLVTGIPILYLEDAIEYMIWGDAIEKIGNKYATNFIITSIEQIERMRNLLADSVIVEMTDTLVNFISDTEDAWRGIGFYGSDFYLTHLYYILIPSLIYSVVKRFREKSSILPKQRPLRKDGGYGWFIVSEGIERIDENFSGCNEYHFDSKGGQSGRFIYYWNGDTFDDGLNRVLRKARFFLNSIGLGNACLFPDDIDASRALANGLCHKGGGRFYPSIPVFTPDEYSKLEKWALNCDVIDSIWEKWIEALFQEYKNFTPKRLVGQIGGNVESFSFNATALIIKELVHLNLILKPEKDKVFTKNLLLIR
ncbi:MAG: sigma-70 family RNA polymerase sigma factor [Firmicutes bacterium]|nr:sigma-70 family RNA polymerase sigma factor [Bacillota bacterium]